MTNHSEKPRIKAVIFDMDGVLVDTEPVSWQVYRQILENFNQDMSLAHYTAHYSGKSEKENVARLVSEYHLPYDPEKFVDESLRLEAIQLDQGVELKKGVKETLKWLKQNQYRCALATSSETQRAFKLLNKHGLVSSFEIITDSSGFTKRKPDPEVFEVTRQKLGLAPEECLVIEDSENGILAAATAAIPVILIPDLKMPSPEIVDKTAAVLTDLCQLPEWLNKH